MTQKLTISEQLIAAENWLLDTGHDKDVMYYLKIGARIGAGHGIPSPWVDHYHRSYPLSGGVNNTVEG